MLCRRASAASFGPKRRRTLPKRVDTFSDIVRAMQACWQCRRGALFRPEEMTIRISFRRNGEVLGKPRITYYRRGRA